MMNRTYRIFRGKQQRTGLFFLFFFGVCAHASTLTSLVVQNEPNRAASTLQCTLSSPFRYHAFTLTNPDRVVIDLLDTSSRRGVVPMLKGPGLVAHVRVGQPSPQTQRVVLDVSAPVRFTISPGKTSLRVQLVSKRTGDTSVRSLPRTPPVSTTVSTKRSPRSAYRDVVIVLDPGHGGHDPGAIGSTQHVEKKVVLAIAQRLKQLIDAEPGMHAVLTRNGDYYVGLRERLMIARKHNADVFISIHADAFINVHSHGASVFALSPRGATSEAARWLAEKENYSELGGINLKGLDDKSGLIRTVLLDLSQTATIAGSLQLGAQVLHDLDRMTTLHNHKVEQARFVVLKSPDTPSILVETGFISNPAEAKNLTDPRYQARLAQAIFAGLKRYFWTHPPHGTRLEAMSNANQRVAHAPGLSARADAMA